MQGAFTKPERFPLTGPLDIEDYEKYVTQSKADFFKLIGFKWVEEADFSDFQIRKQIGSGSFGTVYLVQYKKNNNFLAMKTIEKDRIIKTKQISNTKKEMDVLKCITYPFAIYLEHFFKDNTNLYFILPFITGGELYGHLTKLGRFTEHQARFLGAQVILGIEYLHTLNIIYRDLKPENLLIDRTGYLKLADFGFAKIVKARTYTICGTPEYMAPEIINNKGYSKAVDWWSVGILVYEMVLGKTPFFNKKALKMYENAAALKYEMPPSFTADLQDLVTNILQVDLTRRYGNLVNGANDIKNHKWFCTIEWLSLFNRKVTPPYMPKELPTNSDSTISKSLSHASSVDKYKKEFQDF